MRKKKKKEKKTSGPNSCHYMLKESPYLWALHVLKHAYICGQYPQALQKQQQIMGSLLSQFTLLSDQGLHNKNFDPSTIEDLTKLFEVEAYKSWAAIELEHHHELEDTEIVLQEVKEQLEQAMDAAMEEFRRFEEEMERMANTELNSILRLLSTLLQHPLPISFFCIFVNLHLHFSTFAN